LVFFAVLSANYFHIKFLCRRNSCEWQEQKHGQQQLGKANCNSPIFRDLREYDHEGCASMRERTECVSELKERSYSVGWQICLLPLRLALDATPKLP
jgi:hypothetical protein